MGRRRKRKGCGKLRIFLIKISLHSPINQCKWNNNSHAQAAAGSLDKWNTLYRWTRIVDVREMSYGELRKKS